MFQNMHFVSNIKIIDFEVLKTFWIFKNDVFEFWRTMNLNFGFSKTMNLNFEFTKTMILNFPTQITTHVEK